MKELLEYITKNIVSKPDNIYIEEESDEGGVTLKLSVDPEDMGIVIGKGGQTIQSIRRLLNVKAMSENKRVFLQLNDPSEQTESSNKKETSAAK